jgi:hypothetical protein
VADFSDSKGFWNVIEHVGSQQLFYPLNDPFDDSLSLAIGGTILWNISNDMLWENGNTIIWDSIPD